MSVALRFIIAICCFLTVHGLPSQYSNLNFRIVLLIFFLSFSTACRRWIQSTGKKAFLLALYESIFKIKRSSNVESFSLLIEEMNILPTIQFAAAKDLEPESRGLTGSFTSLVQPGGRSDPGTIMCSFSRCSQKR